jgi:alpha-glucosidase
MVDSTFTSIGNVRKTIRGSQHIEFVCQHGRVRIEVLSDAIVRVRATKTEFGPDFSYAVDKREWPKTKVSITAGMATTQKLRVSFTKSPLRITFATCEGVVLNRDEKQGMGWEGEKCRSYRELHREEKFFGCGEKTGQMNKRGQSFAFWNTDNPTHTYLNDEVYVSIPFLLSTRPGAHYGIFWDNTHRTFFNLGHGEESRYYLGADAGEIDYYFFGGESIKEVVHGYTELTGRMWLPPRWALGYQQCRWSYMSADEILDVAKNFRKCKIPCDVIYCDIDYMDGYRVWTWNPKTFPNPREFLAKLRKMGFKVVTIIDPGVKDDDGYIVCREAKEQGMLVKKPEGHAFVGDVWPGPSVFPDFTSPRVRQWWGQWHKEFLDLGVAGFWNDMNEPAVFNGPGHSMPLDNLHDYDGQGATHARAHNVYGFNMARACHEGLRKLRPNERPFVITRAAYAGIQRYSMVWTGDNHSTWEQFELSIRQCLNLSLSGIPFCGPDVGGFSWDTTGELLARWTQAGAFFPFFRNHTATGTRRQEPWAFGKKIEDVCREAIRFRYRLMPYIYGLFREAALDGTPIMRPLFWEFPDDANAYAIDDQFLLGPSLLVAPVLKPGARARAVYMPAGDWYNYRTQERLTGGQYVGVDAPLEVIPVFVRAGTILPVESNTLEIYPGPHTTGLLYEDDGQSFDFERGRYSLTHFMWKAGKLRVDKKKTGYRRAAKSFAVRVFGR